MELRFRELLTQLSLSEKELRKLILTKQIPAYKIGNEYRFNRNEITDWLILNQRPIPSSWLENRDSTPATDLPQLLAKGGIYRSIAGETPAEVIRQAVTRIPLPAKMTPDLLLHFLLEREELMPTAIGNGIAVPHPRNPAVSDFESECLALFLLDHPIEYGALDDQPVHSLFIILSANPRRHLEILAKISTLCRKQEWLELLQRRASSEAIMEAARNCEQTWRNRKIRHG